MVGVGGRRGDGRRGLMSIYYMPSSALGTHKYPIYSFPREVGVIYSTYMCTPETQQSINVKGCGATPPGPQLCCQRPCDLSLLIPNVGIKDRESFPMVLQSLNEMICIKDLE